MAGSTVNSNTVSATASGTQPFGEVSAIAVGGGITVARNEELVSKANSINDSTVARNSVRAAYTGTGSGYGQALAGESARAPGSLTPR